MYVLGFPAVKSVNAHSFQKIGTQKSCGQFGEWDPATYSVEDSLFGTIANGQRGYLIVICCKLACSFNGIEIELADFGVGIVEIQGVFWSDNNALFFRHQLKAGYSRAQSDAAVSATIKLELVG